LICKLCSQEGEFRPKRRICRNCERQKARERMFEYTRGISYEERDRLLAEQDFKCKACGTSDPASVKGWH